MKKWTSVKPSFNTFEAADQHRNKFLAEGYVKPDDGKDGDKLVKIKAKEGYTKFVVMAHEPKPKEKNLDQKKAEKESSKEA